MLAGSEVQTDVSAHLVRTSIIQYDKVLFGIWVENEVWSSALGDTLY